MSLARQVAHLMAHLSRDDLDALPPAERRRFAEQCRYWAKIADKPAGNAARNYVQIDLSSGDPRRE